MFGSHWDKAEATIAARLPKFSGDGTSVSYEFVADVRPESGAPAFRATLKPPTIATDFWPPNIGDVVSVLVKSNGKVKFDKDDPRISVKAYEAGRKAAFEEARNQPAQPEQAYGSAGFDSVPRAAQVFTMGSAGPEQMRAAAAKLRAAGMGALADQLEQSGQAGQPVGSYAGPEAGAQPGTATAGSANGAADPAARLGKLENLRRQGLLTDAEYATQRQRILDDL
jgi:hypothetical protein